MEMSVRCAFYLLNKREFLMAGWFIRAYQNGNHKNPLEIKWTPYQSGGGEILFDFYLEMKQRASASIVSFNYRRTILSISFYFSARSSLLAHGPCQCVTLIQFNGFINGTDDITPLYSLARPVTQTRSVQS